MKRLEYRPNDDFKIQPEQEDINMKLKFTVTVHKDEKLPEASVDLTCELGEKKSDYPYYLCVTETAKFLWSGSIDDAANLKFLLEKNAPALLLSFLRPVVWSITGLSPYPVYQIPFIDFTEH